MDKETPEAKYWGDSGKSGMPGDWPGGGGGGKGTPVLNEIRFWTRIMKEHAMFIAAGLPCDRPDLIRTAKEFEARLADLEAKTLRANTVTPSLVRELREAVSDLIEFKYDLLRMMLECQLRPNLFPLLIDHITREAVHFLALLDMVCETHHGDDHHLRMLLSRVVFWIRIMKEHIEFVIHLLDPSERSLINQAQELRRVFVRLLQTARELESMANARPRFFNSAARFVDEAIARTTELRDFKGAAYELLLMCKLLSAIPSPLLADHIRREADMAIMEMREIREHIPVRKPTCP